MEKEKKLTLIFSGMAGSGKSSLARKMAEKFRLKYLAGGDILKEMAEKEGYRVSGNDWWETQEGIKFLGKRKKDFRFDMELDKIMLQKAEEGGCALTSWAIPWLGAKGIKIWVEAAEEVRAKRIAGRDGIPYKSALKLIKTRDRENIALYRKMRGYTLGRDLGVFDIVLDANKKGIEELAGEITAFILKRRGQKYKTLQKP